VDERGLHLAVREARSSAAARAMLASCSASWIRSMIHHGQSASGTVVGTRTRCSDVAIC
jgi:hypothetical protein